MTGPQWVQSWEGGRHGLSHRQRESWSLSPGIESQIESSHENDVTVGLVMSSTVGPVR
jgi:hypothetical protein